MLYSLIFINLVLKNMLFSTFLKEKCIFLAKYLHI